MTAPLITLPKFVASGDHEFEDIINTQIHSHMKEGKCLETFLIQGKADRVKYLLNLFQTSDKMEYVKLIVA